MFCTALGVWVASSCKDWSWKVHRWNNVQAVAIYAILSTVNS